MLVKSFPITFYIIICIRLCSRKSKINISCGTIICTPTYICSTSCRITKHTSKSKWCYYVCRSCRSCCTLRSLCSSISLCSSVSLCTLSTWTTSTLSTLSTCSSLPLSPLSPLSTYVTLITLSTSRS